MRPCPSSGQLCDIADRPAVRPSWRAAERSRAPVSNPVLMAPGCYVRMADIAGKSHLSMQLTLPLTPAGETATLPTSSCDRLTDNSPRYRTPSEHCLPSQSGGSYEGSTRPFSPGVDVPLN